MKMTLMEERRRSQIRQRIMRSRPQPEPAQLKINLDTRQVRHVTPTNILIEEIGWEAYEWQRR
jgi:hypothetical protein